MAWVSPTGFVDPDTEWDFETQIYDENTETRGRTLGNDHYVQLTLASPINCDKVQIWAASRDGPSFYDPDIDIDVFYDGGWHNIFSGVITKLTWVEKTIGSTESIDKARIKWNDIIGGIDDGNLYEFDFNEVGDGETFYQTLDATTIPLAGCSRIATFFQSLVSTVTPSAALDVATKFIQSLAAITTPSAALSKVVKKFLAATTAPSAAIVKFSKKTLSATTTGLAALKLQKRIQLVLAAVTTPSAELVAKEVSPMATAIHQGRVVIAIASTRVALSTTQEVNWIDMRAIKENQGVVKVGSSSVTCDGSATDGRSLWPGEPMKIDKSDLAKVFFNGKVVGDGVEYCAGSGT